MSDYQRDCARRARFLALECAMYEAAAGVRHRLPLAASRYNTLQVQCSTGVMYCTVPIVPMAAGVRHRLPLAASRGIPHDGGHFTQSRGAGRTARRQWAFHDPEVGTGFDLGGG